MNEANCGPFVFRKRTFSSFRLRRGCTTSTDFATEPAVISSPLTSVIYGPGPLKTGTARTPVPRFIDTCVPRDFCHAMPPPTAELIEHARTQQFATYSEFALAGCSSECGKFAAPPFSTDTPKKFSRHCRLFVGWLRTVDFQAFFFSRHTVTYRRLDAQWSHGRGIWQGLLAGGRPHAPEASPTGETDARRVCYFCNELPNVTHAARPPRQHMHSRDIIDNWMGSYQLILNLMLSENVAFTELLIRFYHPARSRSTT